jgi:phage antirepressor YoqD-like protein
MKNLMMLALSCLMFAACSSNQLDREKALEILKNDGYYPYIADRDIYCGDPKHAKQVIDAGLEAEGLLTVQRTVKLGDIGKEPIIRFTEKARPYLLETPAKDKAYKIQRVKLADEELVEITGVQIAASGKSATVEYTTAYKNITPFAKLIEKDFSKPLTRTRMLALYDDGWRIEKRR